MAKGIEAYECNLNSKTQPMQGVDVISTKNWETADSTDGLNELNCRLLK